MKRVDTHGLQAAAEASRRFVNVDAGQAGAAEELARWLDEHPQNEHALARAELAVALAKRLAADPGSVLFAEAAKAVRIAPRTRSMRRTLVWGGALAAGLFVAVFFLFPQVPSETSPGAVTLRAAELAAVAPSSDPVAVLPSGLVVDASAVAVLPFTIEGDAELVQLERDIVAALRTVPGLYVIADSAVEPYAATELSAAEIGGQLGARGIVDAAVELVEGRVRGRVRLREAATGATLWRADVDRPIADLSAIRYEIAENVAATMLDPTLRKQAAGASTAPVSVSKPLQQ